jgi:hypothetical protein
MIEAAIKEAQSGSVDAVQVLLDIAGDRFASPSVRVAAARAILDLGVKGKELFELEARLKAVEAAMQEVAP